MAKLEIILQETFSNRNIYPSKEQAFEKAYKLLLTLINYHKRLYFYSFKTDCDLMIQQKKNPQQM